MQYEKWNTDLKKWEKISEEDFKPGGIIEIDDLKHIRQVSTKGQLVDDFGRVIGNYALCDLE